METPAGLVVYLRERPVEGAANAALIAVLSEYFHVAKSQIHIKHGSRGRTKLVEIA